MCKKCRWLSDYKVANHFVKSGYKLADEFLVAGNSCISNTIDSILGAEYCVCMLETDIFFLGERHVSSKDIRRNY